MASWLHMLKVYYLEPTPDQEFSYTFIFSGYIHKYWYMLDYDSEPVTWDRVRAFTQ